MSRIYNVTVVDGVRILTPTGVGYAPIRIEASDFTEDLWEELAINKAIEGEIINPDTRQIEAAT